MGFVVGEGPFPAIDKDPNAILDYTFDWTAWLGVDDISSATFQATAGLTVATSSATLKKATVWISGGEAGKTYLVTCHITSAGGRQEDRTIQLNVSER
jgi:hypothetical protein